MLFLKVYRKMEKKKLDNLVFDEVLFASQFSIHAYRFQITLYFNFCTLIRFQLAKDDRKILQFLRENANKILHNFSREN